MAQHGNGSLLSVIQSSVSLGGGRCSTQLLRTQALSTQWLCAPWDLQILPRILWEKERKQAGDRGNLLRPDVEVAHITLAHFPFPKTQLRHLRWLQEKLRN